MNILLYYLVTKNGKHWWDTGRYQRAGGAGGASRRAGVEIPQHFVW